MMHRVEKQCEREHAANYTDAAAAADDDLQQYCYY